MAFQFDEIGIWSEVKLEIIGKYGAAYTGAFSNFPNLKKYYIDGFSGPGVHRSRATGEQVEGSPTIALNVSPPFDGYYFIDQDPEKTNHLRSLYGDRSDVHILTGDCNEVLVKEVLPPIRYEKFTRALCLLDPYGLHLDWNVMLMAGQSRAVDMFLNFPVMDINRNAIWTHPEDAPPDGIERLTRWWGDESWKQVAYEQERQLDFFGKGTLIKKKGNADIVAAFQQRLSKQAGFSRVPEPLAMKNSIGSIVYYLFFASSKPVAEKIVTDIFKKYR